ncbi:hypothetical protein EsH8_VII_000133 [Colletotrichum jinshuiense]
MRRFRSSIDAVHSAVKGAAIWDYIVRLLEHLETKGDDKIYKAILLQEISNLCHLEFARSLTIFKRNVQTGVGFKRFKRLSGAYDSNGNAKVALKGKPEDLLISDPQLHYVLRLCQADMSAAKSIEWLKKLSDLHQAHPSERENLTEREAQALGNLAVIVGFIQDLSPAVSMPPLSRKKGQLFISRAQELEAELNQDKKDLDLRDFAVPIDDLLEPGVADGTLKVLEQFVIDKTGAKLGHLYQDLVGDCFSDLQSQYENFKAKASQDQTAWTPLPVPPPEPKEKLVEQRRQKEKTRPSGPSAYDIVPVAQPVEEQSQPAQAFKVDAATAEVFANLFRKSEARAPVAWTAFEGAMADLGFSVLPKYGSVFTFMPPESMAVKKPFTVHRPHKSWIEGYTSLIFAQRLKRAYGWGEDTFEVV